MLHHLKLVKKELIITISYVLVLTIVVTTQPIKANVEASKIIEQNPYLTKTEIVEEEEENPFEVEEPKKEKVTKIKKQIDLEDSKFVLLAKAKEINAKVHLELEKEGYFNRPIKIEVDVTKPKTKVLKLETESPQVVYSSYSKSSYNIPNGSLNLIEPKTQFEQDLRDFIDENAKIHDLNPDMILAVIKVESNFNPKVINKNTNGTKDYGLMQINSCNHDKFKKLFGITDFLNPKQNLKCGIHMLGTLKKAYPNDDHKLLTAYNRGVGGMNKLFKKGYTSSKYSEKVISYMGSQ